MTFSQLLSLFSAAGCTRLYAKALSENDNSKNQVYFAGAVEALNIFPSKQVLAENTNRGPSFKAHLDFAWLLDSGAVAPASGAQLILYAQYPEVRFSGFLKGCEAPPSDLMTQRLEGRVLFLGVTGDGRVVGRVEGPESQVSKEFQARAFRPTVAVFVELELPSVPSSADARTELLAQLSAISRKGWITSGQLGSDGVRRACNAPQCGGFTLEAELGISKNSKADPDFLGWEVKQHGVTRLDRILSGGPITLMTPEPTGGIYHDAGVETFIRKFGYADRRGRADRFNVGGIHRVGRRVSATKLTLQVVGYDGSARKITDADGCLALLSDSGEVAASWDFAGLLRHWSRKHSKTAYIPSICRLEPERQYSYGNRVRLAQRTDSLRLLAALAAGSVYYDPGIKLENASKRGLVKRRSQFRIASKNISTLYETVEIVDV